MRSERLKDQLIRTDASHLILTHFSGTVLWYSIIVTGRHIRVRRDRNLPGILFCEDQL
jgi:hypothetical protein